MEQIPRIIWPSLKRAEGVGMAKMDVGMAKMGVGMAIMDVEIQVIFK